LPFCTPWRILELLHARCRCARFDGPPMHTDDTDNDDDFKRLPRGGHSAQCTSPFREHGHGMGKMGRGRPETSLPAKSHATVCRISRWCPSTLSRPIPRHNSRRGPVDCWPGRAGLLLLFSVHCPCRVEAVTKARAVKLASPVECWRAVSIHAGYGRPSPPVPSTRQSSDA
jgi:hypothetical protein